MIGWLSGERLLAIIRWLLLWSSGVSEVTVYEMDAMGAWSCDDSTAWFPRSQYPTRASVRTRYSDHTGVPWIEIRVLARYAVHAPDDPGADEYDGAFWVECPKDTPGAFPVWRCE